jgi:hypothetical protein
MFGVSLVQLLIGSQISVTSTGASGQLRPLDSLIIRQLREYQGSDHRTDDLDGLYG